MCMYCDLRKGSMFGSPCPSINMDLDTWIGWNQPLFRLTRQCVTGRIVPGHHVDARTNHASETCVVVLHSRIWWVHVHDGVRKGGTVVGCCGG